MDKLYKIALLTFRLKGKAKKENGKNQIYLQNSN